MAKREDVAREAKVSTATVSHVLNHTKYVSPELRDRVLLAVNKLHYYPNKIAQSMVTKKSKHFAMLVNNLKNPRYSEIAEAMQNEAAKYGYIVSIISYDSFGIGPEGVLQMIARNIDGMFVATYVDALESSLRLAQRSGMTVLCAADGFGTVLNTDYRTAIYDLVTDLVRFGHTRIGYISGYSVKESQHKKLQYFREALEMHQIPCREEYVIDGNPTGCITPQTGYEAMDRLLKQRPSVTAVFCVNDLAAIGALRCAKDRGLRIPEDLSIVGCDNIDLARYCTPALSTIDVPKYEMGASATNMLLKLERGETPEDVWIRADYIRRESTGPCKKRRTTRKTREAGE